MLPVVKTNEQFSEIDLKSSIFIEAAKNILNKNAINVLTTDRPSSGSLPVVLLNNQYVVKFFPEVFFDEHLRELKGLQFLTSNGIRVPKIIDSDDIYGWRYVLMSKLGGDSLKLLWENLSITEKKKASFIVGQNLRKQHDIKISPKDFDLTLWPLFLKQQALGCYSRHKKIGLHEPLLNQIESFLNKLNLDTTGCSFLHTEIMKEHVFFDFSKQGAELTGFIDFEPSMVGSPEYDFASVGVFLASGDKTLLRAFYEGYGNLDEAQTSDFSKRIMGYTLLHKYSNLKWYLQFMPNADTLDELSNLWFKI